MRILLFQVQKGPDTQVHALRIDVPHGRALRLIEQGKAVPVREAKKPGKKEKAATAGERDGA